MNVSAAADLTISVEWSNAVCSEGYTGPLCDSCDIGFWKTPASTCERCKTYEQDSQRGDQSFQYAVYGGGFAFASVCILATIGVYLRQDEGRGLFRTCCRCFGHHSLKRTEPMWGPNRNYMDGQFAALWFRPEKFKILLSFLQIFSQMNSNYGILWPSITADYMRFLTAVNFDLVRLAALDCLFRSDFYFSLTLVCALPFGGLAVLGAFMLLGRSFYSRYLRKHPRHCIKTGLPVERPMSEKMFLALRLRVARDITRNEDYHSAKAAHNAIRRAMGSNKTGLPVGSYVRRGMEQTKCTMTTNDMREVVQTNLSVFRIRVLQRIEYLRFTNKIWKLFFWLLLLIYPAISTRVFRIFACMQVGSVYVLRCDLNVECFTGRWYSYSFGAITALLVFVIGIPSLFFSLMWKARNQDIGLRWNACEQSSRKLHQYLKEAEEDAIMLREHWQLDKDGDGDPTDEEKKSAVIDYLRRKNMRFHRTFERLGFLYYAYNERHWWYEIVELSRKLILNGVIVLVPEAVTARILIGLITCLAYALTVSVIRPYTTKSDFTLQIMCHTQLFITMFAGLLIKAEVPILGFSPHLRPLESQICGWLVVVSHSIVCLWGVSGIIWERFFSNEVLRAHAARRRHSHNLKVRISKFKRAKKKLMTKVHAGSVFGAGSVLGTLSSNQSNEVSINGAGSPHSHSTVLGALMVIGPESGGNARKISSGSVPTSSGLNFAWPGRENHDSEALSVMSRSESDASFSASDD